MEVNSKILPVVTVDMLIQYLTERHQRPISIRDILSLKESKGSEPPLKGFGYGHPFRVRYEVEDQLYDVVVRPVLRNGYGRERNSDRVGEVWRDYGNFSLLPRHVPALDIIGIQDGETLVSLGHVQECLLLTEYAEGIPYASDLLRIRDSGKATALDEERAQMLASYLVEIHREKHDDPLLWRRRLRDLIGHGEGIMGITDGYRDVNFVSDHTLRSIEDAANSWRWKLKENTNRLCQVHGDYHPFNILFDEGIDFRVIDRSRGTWGAAADDVAALSINFLFFSLQRGQKLEEPFQTLYEIFWNTYLYQSGDVGILQTIAPWFAWRALVLASQAWYPHIRLETRQRLINFARNVLADGRFDWQGVNHYLGV